MGEKSLPAATFNMRLTDEDRERLAILLLGRRQKLAMSVTPEKLVYPRSMT
jgi:hypothetical protein